MRELSYRNIVDSLNSSSTEELAECYNADEVGAVNFLRDITGKTQQTCEWFLDNNQDMQTIIIDTIAAAIEDMEMA